MRTKGSLNKKTIEKMKASKPNKSGVYTINLEKQIENNPIVKDKARKWVTIGVRNTYYYDLLNLFNTSVTFKACVNFAKRAIVGQGLDLEQMKLKDEDLANPNYFTDWNTFIDNFTLDYILYGSAAFQIIMNKDKKTYSFFNVPFDTLRPSPMDENGVINSYWMCQDWTQYSLYPPIEMPTFGFQDDEEISYGKPYIFVMRSYNPTNIYFPSPRYLSALNQIQAEAEMQKYDLAQATNQFIPQGMLTMPMVESDEERRAILDNLQAKYQGSSNAGSLMVTFRTNNEEQPVNYTPFVASSENVNLYDTANDRITSRICEGFNIPSKMLIGIPVDNQGFSDQGNVIQAAFNLYNTNTASNDRTIISSAINQALKINGIDTQIVFKPLNYIIEDSSSSVRGTDTTTETIDQPAVNEDNATEQVME